MGCVPAPIPSCIEGRTSPKANSVDGSMCGPKPSSRFERGKAAPAPPSPWGIQRPSRDTRAPHPIGARLKHGILRFEPGFTLENSEARHGENPENTGD